nr:amidohydrolase family protein [Streptomyces sp. TSRI0107]
MALTIANDTGHSPLDVLDDFRTSYFDTALSSSPSALPTLLAFARPGHVLFGSDWPFAPTPASQYFAAGLDTHLEPSTLTAVNRTNAEAVLPRLATAALAAPGRPLTPRLPPSASPPLLWRRPATRCGRPCCLTDRTTTTHLIMVFIFM